MDTARTLSTLTDILDGTRDPSVRDHYPSNYSTLFQEEKAVAIEIAIAAHLKYECALCDELAAMMKDGFVLNPEQAANVGTWMWNMHPVLAMRLWAGLNRNVANLFSVHPYVEKLMVYLGIQASYIPTLSAYMHGEKTVQELGFKD